MAYEPGRNPYNPLIIGAIAVIVALVAFLVFRESTGPTQQAGIEAPPAATSPGVTPTPGPPGEPNPAPTTPDTPPASQPAPQGQGAQ
jgi:hypothetical protein